MCGCKIGTQLESSRADSAQKNPHATVLIESSNYLNIVIKMKAIFNWPNIYRNLNWIPSISYFVFCFVTQFNASIYEIKEVSVQIEQFSILLT